MTPQEELAALRRLAELEAKMSGASPQQAQPGVINALGQGLNTRLANILGTPVDLATAAIGTIGHQTGLLREPPALEQSFGGSASIRRGMERLGLPTYGNIRELPPDLRPFAVGGETFMGSVAPGLAGVGLAQATRAAAGSIPRLVDPATRLAQEFPRRFLAAEAGMSGGAATGAAIAEMAAPGSPGARLAGELIGGTASPIAMTMRAGGPVVDTLRRTIESFTPSGRETAAARTVQQMFAATGESPQLVINALRKQDPLGINLTAGQRTASPTMLGLETRLAQSSPQFKAEASRLATEGFERLQGLGQNIAGEAPIKPLAEAARKRVVSTQGLAQAREAAARQAAQGTREAIGDVTESGMTAASVAAREALEGSVSAARAQERQLWSKIPRDIEVEPTGVLAARERIREGLLPNESMPQPIETFTGNLARGAGRNVEVAQVTPEGVPMIGTEEVRAAVTSGDLLRLRNRALDAARNARNKANPDYDLARQMNEIADGALEDLSRIDIPAVAPAREYSRNLNQALTRGAPAEVMARAPGGGDRVPAEVTLERAFRGSGFTNAGGGTRGSVAFRELAEGAQFGGQGQQMLDAQETFLRGAAQATIGSDGRVKPDALRQFLRRNEEILTQFPQLRSQLANAERAERVFLQMSAISSKAQKNAARTLLGQMTQTGNDPVSVVTDVIRSNNPRAGIESLARSAQRAGPDAVGGLRSATLESLFKQASGKDGKIDFARLNQAMNVPGSYQPGAESIMQTMRRTGVLDEKTQQNLQTIIDRANILTRAVGTRSDFDRLMQDPDMLTDFIVRSVGANIGAMAGRSTGATLVAAQAGSAALRNIINKMPAAKTQAILIEAAKDPVLMVRLLQKPTNVNQAREAMRQINGYMLNAGVEFAYDSDEEARPLQRSLDTIGQ